MISGLLCFIMLAYVLIVPHLASPKLVLRFLPEDVYEEGKDHPEPSLPRKLLGYMLLLMVAAYKKTSYMRTKAKYNTTVRRVL